MQFASVNIARLAIARVSVRQVARTGLLSFGLLAVCVFAGLLTVVSADFGLQRPALLLAIPLLMLLGFMLVIAPRMLLFGVVLLRAVINPLFEGATLPGIGGLGGLVNLSVIVLTATFLARDPERVPRVAWMVWLPFLLSQFVGLTYSPDFLPELRLVLGQMATMCMFLLAFYVVDDWPSFDRMLKLVLVASVPVAIYTLIAIARGDSHVVAEGYEAAAGRYKGPFSHPNILAFFLVLVQGVLLYLWKRIRSRAGLGERLAMAAYMLVLLALLFATKTRSAWLSAAFLFLIYGLFVERRFLVYLCIAPALAMLVPEVRERLLDLGQGNAVVQYARLNSFAWRKLLWTDALAWMSPFHYLFGYGGGGFYFHSPTFFSFGGRIPTGAHSVAVQLLFDLGVVGLACFYWMYWRVTRLLIPVRDVDRLFVVVFIALVFSYVVVSLSDNMLSYLVFNWYFWFVVGAGCSIACKEAPVRPDLVMKSIRSAVRA